MFGAHGNPFGCRIGMMGQDMSFEPGEVVRQTLKTETEFLGALRAALPEVMRNNRPFDLDAGGQAESNDLGGEFFGVGARGQGGPSDEHAAAFPQERGRGKPRIDP
jgi:hypothetical protein